MPWFLFRRLRRCSARRAPSISTASCRRLRSTNSMSDGEVGEQAFAVIRDAIAKEGMAALGRVVLSTREHVIAVHPRGKGLSATTLRYPYEVRKAEGLFR